MFGTKRERERERECVWLMKNERTELTYKLEVIIDYFEVMRVGNRSVGTVLPFAGAAN